VAQRGGVELTAAQRRALLVLASECGASLTRREYARLTGVARSQASCDLSELVSAGLVVRVGRGRSTRYELALWTPGGTGLELEANELGLSDRAANAPRGPRRGRLVWALVGVAALAALAAAARGLPLVATHGFGSTIRAITGAAAPVEPPAPRERRPAPTVAAPHASARAPKSERITRPAAKPAVKPAPPVQQPDVQQRTYVSNVVQTVPAHTAPAPSGTSSAAATAPESGPAPLPAPAGPSPPSPLKAP
jgi:hypothetical protein